MLSFSFGALLLSKRQIMRPNEYPSTSVRFIELALNLGQPLTLHQTISPMLNTFTDCKFDEVLLKERIIDLANLVLGLKKKKL